MPETLGKRKRTADGVRVSRKRQEVESESNQSEDSDSGSESGELDAQEIFRRHFEAQFEALPQVVKPVVEDLEISGDSDQEDDEDEEWAGISGEEEDSVVVVQHTTTGAGSLGMTREELKAFMSHKPPSSTTKPAVPRDKSIPEEDDASESANLKKDLALQRLLTESHLLESSTNPVLAGNNRHKATDLRLQALGSKKSILQQEKMPMSHRKGIAAKAVHKEEIRRREARENGIILEKAKMVKKKGADARRDRGVGGPGLGRFSGGTLTLSKKDIMEIEGPRRGGAGRGGKGGSKSRGGGSKRGRR